MRIVVKVTERDIKKGMPYINQDEDSTSDDALVLAVKRALKRAGIRRKLKVEAWWGGEIKIGGKFYWPDELRDMPDLYLDEPLTKVHIKWMSTPRTFTINYHSEVES